MKTIALFGGSFDPPTAAHAKILQWLVQGKDSPALDGIWVLPTVDHPFGKELTPYEHREKMLEILLRKYDSSYAGMYPRPVRNRPQIVRREEKYTVDTLEALHIEFPDTKFLLVVGADCMRDHSQWHRWDRCLELAELLVIDRPGVEIENGTNIQTTEVSSSSIRERLSRGDLTYLEGPEGWADLNENILAYIMAKGLYGYKEQTPPEPCTSISKIFLPEKQLLKFGPGIPFCLYGYIKEILSVEENPEGVTFTVLNDTRRHYLYQRDMKAWRVSQTRARHEGKVFEEPKPKPMSTPILYMDAEGPPLFKEQISGKYIGNAGKYHFWLPESSSLLNSIFGIF